MPKKNPKPLSPWLSKIPDCRDKRFIQIGNSFLLSKEAQKLSTGARCLYFDMAMEAGGRINFKFPQSAAFKYGISKTSFDRYLKELIKRKFIEIVSSGKTTREPNNYKFSMSWKQNST